MSDNDTLVQIAADTAANKELLKSLAPLVEKIHETIHVRCGIDGNGDASLVSIVRDNYKFVKACGSWLTGGRKAAIYGALGVVGSTAVVVIGRCAWLLVVWLWGG